TQDNYNESHLIYVQGQLSTQDQQLGDQLAALSASSRIIAEAERLGMVSGGTWTYAEEPSPSASPSPVAESATPPPSSAGPALAAVAGALHGALGGPGW
ncbi:MAG: hypothetical protein WCB85_02350, partial [Candidatus Dormiibacterota bacterium]